MNWATVRQAALRRDGYQCVRCLLPAADVHHRRQRGMGGTKNEGTAFGLDNLISVCRHCHSYIHAHPSESYELGYLLRLGQDPAAVPVQRRGVCGPLF